MAVIGERRGEGGPWPEGWPLTAGVVALLTVFAAGVVLVQGPGEEAWRLVLRVTGRASAALFLGAFAASGLHVLWPSPTSRWLRRNRRWVGLSFAGSQTVHLVALIVIATGSVRFRQGVDAATLVVGGGGYVFTYAMALTSFDGAMRRLGRWWRRLHLVGGWWIYFVFLATLLPDAPRSAAAAVLSAGLLGTALVRFLAARRRRTRA